MRVISKKKLREFYQKHAGAKDRLEGWYAIFKGSSYKDSHEVRQAFPTADFLGNGVTVFDIGGNKYRLVVQILYRFGLVYVQHVLTHAEYDKLNKAGTLLAPAEQRRNP